MTIRGFRKNNTLQKICGNNTSISGGSGTSVSPGNGYKYEVYTAPTTFTVSNTNLYNTRSKVIKSTTSSNMEVLVVGGGGGSTSNGASAGGGSGGIAYSRSYSVLTPQPIQVGAGGPSPAAPTSRGVTGDPSYFGSIVGNGGGGGGATSSPGPIYGPGSPGGSGGGACGWQNSQTGGSATQPSNPTLGGLVSNYGFGSGISGAQPYYSSAGGGGAGSVSSDVSPVPGGYSTPGGYGRFYSQFSSPLISPLIPSPERTNWSSQVGGSGVYASGGSAGSTGPSYSSQPYPVAAVVGGGGGAASGSGGQNYTGGGCGGANYPPGSSGPKGGDGIVIVRYQTPIDHGDGTATNPIKDAVGLKNISTSGNYWFKTSSMAQSVEYYVDTATGDGNWIRVFLAAQDNYDTTSFSWGSSETPNLISNSSKFMYCYVNTSTNATTQAWSWWFFDGTSDSNYASFRDYPPLYHGGVGSPLITRISALRLSTDTPYIGYYLRTGYSSFGNVCDDSRSGTYGQICLKGSNTSSSTGTGGLLDFPFYNAFSSSAGDFCAGSDESYNGSSCSSTRRFGVYVQI